MKKLFLVAALCLSTSAMAESWVALGLLTTQVKGSAAKVEFVQVGDFESREASSSHNFDFVAGRTKPKYFLNLGMGYNIVDDVFSQVRTLLPEGKTQITWENISR